MHQLFMRRPNLNDLPALPPLAAGYTLRLFRESDLSALANVMAKAFEDDTWTPERFRNTLSEAPDVKEVHVIERSGVPVATASAQLLPDKYPGSGYVHYVAVAPEEQGKNLGYAVTLSVLHAFGRMGCKDAVLQTDDPRLAAIKIYQRLGFQPEHTHETHMARWGAVADLLSAMGL